MAAPTGHSILCLDSNVDVLAYLRELLRRAGYQVQTTDRMSDAMLLLRVSNFDLLLVGPDKVASATSPQAFHAACAKIRSSARQRAFHSPCRRSRRGLAGDDQIPPAASKLKGFKPTNRQSEEVLLLGGASVYRCDEALFQCRLQPLTYPFPRQKNHVLLPAICVMTRNR